MHERASEHFRQLSSPALASMACRVRTWGPTRRNGLRVRYTRATGAKQLTAGAERGTNAAFAVKHPLMGVDRV